MAVPDDKAKKSIFNACECEACSAKRKGDKKPSLPPPATKPQVAEKSDCTECAKTRLMATQAAQPISVTWSSNAGGNTAKPGAVAPQTVPQSNATAPQPAAAASDVTASRALTTASQADAAPFTFGSGNQPAVTAPTPAPKDPKADALAKIHERIRTIEAAKGKSNAVAGSAKLTERALKGLAPLNTKPPKSARPGKKASTAAMKTNPTSTTPATKTEPTTSALAAKAGPAPPAVTAEIVKAKSIFGGVEKPQGVGPAEPKLVSTRVTSGKTFAEAVKQGQPLLPFSSVSRFLSQGQGSGRTDARNGTVPRITTLDVNQNPGINPPHASQQGGKKSQEDAPREPHPATSDKAYNDTNVTAEENGKNPQQASRDRGLSLSSIVSLSPQTVPRPAYVWELSTQRRQVHHDIKSSSRGEALRYISAQDRKTLGTLMSGTIHIHGMDFDELGTVWDSDVYLREHIAPCEGDLITFFDNNLITGPTGKPLDDTGRELDFFPKKELGEKRWEHLIEKLPLKIQLHRWFKLDEQSVDPMDQDVMEKHLFLEPTPFDVVYHLHFNLPADLTETKNWWVILVSEPHFKREGRLVQLSLNEVLDGEWGKILEDRGPVKPFTLDDIRKGLAKPAKMKPADLAAEMKRQVVEEKEAYEDVMLKRYTEQAKTCPRHSLGKMKSMLNSAGDAYVLDHPDRFTTVYEYADTTAGTSLGRDSQSVIDPMKMFVLRSTTLFTDDTLDSVSKESVLSRVWPNYDERGFFMPYRTAGSGADFLDECIEDYFEECPEDEAQTQSEPFDREPLFEMSSRTVDIRHQLPGELYGFLRPATPPASEYPASTYPPQPSSTSDLPTTPTPSTTRPPPPKLVAVQYPTTISLPPSTTALKTPFFIFRRLVYNEPSLPAPFPAAFTYIPLISTIQWAIFHVSIHLPIKVTQHPAFRIHVRNTLLSLLAKVKHEETRPPSLWAKDILEMNMRHLIVYVQAVPYATRKGNLDKAKRLLDAVWSGWMMLGMCRATEGRWENTGFEEGVVGYRGWDPRRPWDLLGWQGYEEVKGAVQADKVKVREKAPETVVGLRTGSI